MAATNSEFEFCGVNHLALVCKDMAKTVAFYRDILGMPLTKTIDLPGGRGQHFFFDMGNGDSLAFSKHLLETGDVAVSPGVGFGEKGEGYVRIALVENEQRIRQAAKGITNALNRC